MGFIDLLLSLFVFGLLPYSLAKDARSVGGQRGKAFALAAYFAAGSLAVLIAGLTFADQFPAYMPTFGRIAAASMLLPPIAIWRGWKAGRHQPAE